MRSRCNSIVMAVSWLSACTLGTRPGNFGPATSPRGIETRLTLEASTILGELVSVSDSGLIVLAGDRRLVHAHWATMRRATFRKLRAALEGGNAPDAATRERIRLVSRFPQGMSPELTARLLESLGRDRIEVLRGPTAAADQRSDSLFAAAARAGSARYGELDSAIADGFRRIGGDFPGMGEHWVHSGRLMSGVVDAARPVILSYASIGGRPTLVGVAYALPLGAGDSLPPVPRNAWHAHAGSVEDASFLPSHAGHMAAKGSRIAVLHAWVWLDNPAGPFATDNPALPFARAGLPPAPASPPALRALALAYGGVPFYASAVSRSASLDDAGRLKILGLLDGGAARARAAIGAHPEGFPDEALEVIWEGVWDDIAAVDPQAAGARGLGFGLEQP